MFAGKVSDEKTAIIPKKAVHKTNGQDETTPTIETIADEVDPHTPTPTYKCI
jgi:hypothetical protein